MGGRPKPSRPAADWSGDFWGRTPTSMPPSPGQELTDCRQLDGFQPCQNKTLTVRLPGGALVTLHRVWIWIFIFRLRANVGLADTSAQVPLCVSESSLQSASGRWNVVPVFGGWNMLKKLKAEKDVTWRRTCTQRSYTNVLICRWLKWYSWHFRLFKFYWVSCRCKTLPLAAVNR